MTSRDLKFLPQKKLLLNFSLPFKLSFLLKKKKSDFEMGSFDFVLLR